MKRVPLLEPWPGPWGRWASRYCANNLWRVSATLGDYNDAMAECAVQYLECRNRYGGLVDDPRWFMALYQRCVTSRFNDLSVKDSRYREIVDSTAVDEVLAGELPIELDCGSLGSIRSGLNKQKARSS